MSSSSTGIGVRPQLVGADVAGVPIEAIAEHMGVAASVLTAPDDLGHERATQLWRAVAELSNNPAIALHAAEAVPYGAFDVLDYIVANTPTVKDGLDAIVQHFAATGSRIELVVEHRASHSGLGLRWTAGLSAQLRRYSSEFTLACLVLRFRHNAKRQWVPRVLRVSHPDLGYRDEFARIFGCPVEFDAGADEIEVDASMRDMAFPSADARLRAILERAAAGIERPQAAADIATRLRSALVDALPGETPRVEALAKTLGLSVRTLHRRLADEGTAFQTVLDDVRAQTAKRLLSRSDLPLAEVAYAVGFTEVSAFSRAFRRWEKVAPGAWRRDRS